MNCETCKERHKQAEPVPYIVHEGEMARMERANRRWFFAWLITFVLLVGAVVFFFWRESQFVDETWTQEVWQDADNGVNRFVGGDYYGPAESEDYGIPQNP